MSTPLEQFGRWCLDESLCGDGCFNLSGEEIKDKAIELGLLDYVTVEEPCSEGCWCHFWEKPWPVQCLRETPLAKGEGE